jgi:hypothetical protein
LKALFFTALLSVLVATALPNIALAGFVCGNLDFLKMSDQETENFLETQSLAVTVGAKPVSCGVPGEKLNICRRCSDQLSTAEWSYARAFLSEQKHRFWHLSWHENFRKEPAFHGESFLFMHRQMIKMFNFEMTASGHGCLAPWSRTQDLGFTEDAEIFDSQIMAIQKEEAKLNNLQYLEKVSLDQLGEDIMRALHVMYHSVYVATETEIKKSCQGDELTSSTCHDLGSNKSAHVDPYFWKFHGLIDSFIGKWLSAHGFKEISRDCGSNTKCYQWRGTYLR